MKLQKITAIYSAIISAIALALSYGFNKHDCTYVSGIFTGVFSSGILIVASSIIAYFVERDKTTLALYHGCFDYMTALNNNLRPSNEIGIETLKNNLAIMKRSYMDDIYFNVCKLAGMCKVSPRRKIVMEIWEAARKIHLLVCDDEDQIMLFYMGDISREELGQYTFKYCSNEGVKHLNDLIVALDKLEYHMNYYNVRKGKKEESAHAN